MLTDPQIHLLALCCIPKLNWYLIAREAQRPGGLKMLLNGEVSEMSPQANEAREILRAGLRELTQAVSEAKNKAQPGFDFGAKLTTVLDDDYPLNLRAIFNLPPFLFYLGELDPDDVRAVAVVGTRKATDDGRRRATKLAHMLVENGVSILSGLASGIDTAAHKAALEKSGRTVAVMGTGICRVFPPENADLASEIANTGALVSQFWPNTSPASYTFPRRNVTMSGMAQGTAVIEASATSGAKMQARLAIEHGKKVFLLKSLVTNYSWARDYLKRGAILVEDDIAVILRCLRDPNAMRRMTRQHRQLRFTL